MFWCALAFIAIISPLIFWLMWREDFDGMQSEWRYYRACKSRQPLSPDEFYEEFYLSSGIEKCTVAGLSEVCVEVYGVKAELIRPEDNYPRAYDGDDELIEAIEARFGIDVKSDDLSAIDGTFDSLARYVQSRLRQPSEPRRT